MANSRGHKRLTTTPRKSSFLKRLKPIGKWLCQQFTFQKIIVVWLVFKGVQWVDQSYALAWAGHSEIASDLSQKALVELLGVALLYSLKSLFENLSKNNSWPDKPSNISPMDIGIQDTTVDEREEEL